MLNVPHERRILPDVMAMRGFATEEGTASYRQRRADHPDHVRRLQDVWASSIGLGTYLGDPDEGTDRLSAQALEAALSLGCNVIDTAINYRCQRSERTIGETLERLIGQGTIARADVALCTKGGYVPFDGRMPADAGRYLIDAFLEPGIIPYDDLVAGCHCLHPRYLAHQLAASLTNLRAEAIDVYYLHNPEQQLEAISRELFMQRMEAAFGLLEQQAARGTIRWYGTATWNGYRTNPNATDYLSLPAFVDLARRVGGDAHHFRVIQVPLNLSMPEAYAFKNQVVHGETLTLLEAAQRLGVSVIASASLLQSQLTKLPQAIQELIPDLQTDAQRAIQFARSVPGVTTALVGMKRTLHVEENLALAKMPALSSDQVGRLFARRTKR